jgi:hypothetical protein
MSLRTTVAQRLVAGLTLWLAFATFALADGIEGTWRLVKRELPDGTAQTPPTVVGLGTVINGQRHLNVFWRTAAGTPASFGLISEVKVTSSDYTETLIASVFDDGSGQPVVYNFSGETKAAAITRTGRRIAYKLPFDPPSVVYDGDRLTATLEGAFVDYWERVK